MKILKVVHSFPPHTFAGAEVYSYQLSKELAKRNGVSVFFRVKNTRDPEYLLKHNNYQGLETYSINHTFGSCESFRGTFRDSNIDEKFVEVLNGVKPDIVHIHHLLFLSHGIIDEIKKRDIPIVYTLHDYWLFCYRGQLVKDNLEICSDHSISGCRECLKFLVNIRKYTLSIYFIIKRSLPPVVLTPLKKIYRFLVRKPSTQKAQDFRESAQSASSKIDRFIAPSNFIRNKFIAEGFPAEKIIHCDNGFITQGYDKSGNRGSNILRFGYLGTLVPTKGVDILIRAFKGIKEKDIELDIYGRLFAYSAYEYYPGLLKKLCKKDKRINLRGEYDNQRIAGILSGIDVLIVPSIWPENSPLVIHEAYLAKVPVVASRIGGIPELVIDGVDGLLFKPGDIQDLRMKLEYVIANRGILNKFRENLPKIKSIEENARELQTIYMSLISR